MNQSLPCPQNSCLIQVRVLPNARHEGWAGMWNGTHIKIALRAPAVDGKANESLINFLSKEIGLPKRNFTIMSGHTNRCKTIQIQGISAFNPPQST